jgi:ribokinase
MLDLVIVGSIGLDDVQTPFGKVEGALGGSAAYAAASASFFAKPGIVSIIGQDLPKKYLSLLEKRGVDLSGLSKSKRNFRWSGSYEFDMSEAKTLKTELNSLENFKPDLPEHFRDCRFLFLANINPELQFLTIKQMRINPFVALDTMNFWINTKKKELLKVIKKVDLVVINEGEARQLFDTPNLITAGRALNKLGPKYAVIKKGEHGALLFSEGAFFSASGYPLETIKDPTGAGDTFAGGLIGYLAKNKKIDEISVRRAVVYGSAVASFCAEDFSLNYLKKINIKHLKERYNAFQEIRRF